MRRTGRRRIARRSGVPKAARSAETAALLAADDLSPVLDSLGIVYKRGSSGRKLLARCPSPDHDDRSASWFINNDPADTRFGTHACLSCGYRGGPVHLVSSSEGGTGGDWESAAKILSDLFVIRGDESADAANFRLASRRASRRRREAVPEADLDALSAVPFVGTPAEEYLYDRGLSRFLCGWLGVLYTLPGSGLLNADNKRISYGHRAVFPVRSGPGGRVETFAARAIAKGTKPKYIYPPVPRTYSMWGFEHFDPTGKDVLLAEGIITAVGGYVVCRRPVFAALGARVSPAQAARLRRARSITVLRDPGDAGRLLVSTLARHLPSVPVLYAALPDRPALDAGDALRHPDDPRRLDPAVLLRAVENASDARMPEPRAVRVDYRRRFRKISRNS